MLLDNPFALDAMLEGLDAQVGMLQGSSISPDALNDYQAAARTQLVTASVNGQIMKAPSSALKALKSGTYDDDIDWSGKLTLIAKAEARIKALNTVDLTATKAAARDATTALMEGLPVKDAAALAAQLEGKTEGIDLQKAIAVQPAMAQFKTLSLTDMASVMADTETMAAKEGITSAQTDILSAQRRLYTRMQAQIKQDPLRAYATNVLQDNVPALTDAATREAMAQAASEHYGVEVSPFTQEETKALASGLRQMASTGDVAGALGELSDYSPPMRRRAAAALANDDPSTAVAIAISDTRPGVSESILRGQSIMGDVPMARADVSAAVPDSFREVFAGKPRALEQNLEAAKAVYADLMQKAGNLPADQLDAELFGEAIEQVLGGEPISYQGGHILPPHESVTTGRDVTRVLRRMTDEDLLKYGSVATGGGRLEALSALPLAGGMGGVAAASVSMEEVAREARLQSVQDGRYYLMVGTGALYGPDNAPVVLDLGKYIEENGIPETVGVPTVRLRN